MKGSIAGKIMLIGEYVALGGGPALLCAVEPRFEFGGAGPFASFHPDSPAGRLVAEINVAPFSFHDPFQGRGGFGASTAQFAAAWRAAGNRVNGQGDVEAAWRAYRSRAGAPIPSGVDLVAQIVGGLVWVSFGEESGSLRVEPESSALLPHIRAYSATRMEGRKTATHEHLKKLSQSGGVAPEVRATLRSMVLNAREVLRRSDLVALGRSFDDFAEALREEGLEHPQAERDRVALRRLPGVLGVKGTGAMLSDALVLVAAPGSDLARIDDYARERGLEPLGPLIPSGGFLG